MALKLGIKRKMLILIMGTVALVYLTTQTYLSYNFRTKALEEAVKLADAYAEGTASNIKASLGEEMAISRSLGQGFEHLIEYPASEREKIQKEILVAVLKGNREYEATWVSWELSAVDPNWGKSYGRQRFTYSLQDGQLNEKIDSANLNADEVGSIYHRIKNTKTEEISEPYFYNNYSGDQNLQLLGSSICIPILIGGEFIGLVGADLSLESFAKMIEVDAFENGYSLLVSHNGTIVSHHDSTFVNFKVDSLSFVKGLDFSLAEEIKRGEKLTFDLDDYEGVGKSFVTFSPIQIGRSKTPWSIGIIIPYNEITKTFRGTFWLSVLVGLMGLVVVSTIIFRLANSITRPLDKINIMLKNLSEGNIDDKVKLEIKSGDEIEEMAYSVNMLAGDLGNKSKFAEEIGKGDLDTDFELRSEGDTLGKSLIEMRSRLRDNKVDNDIRRWVNEGLAKFSEVLRNTSYSAEELYSEIVSTLVKYIAASQGALFLTNNEDKLDEYLEIKGAYAYDRKKFLQKRLDMNEGLVGRCVMEKKSIFLLEIPESYIKVASGLGYAQPKCLLIVPLMSNGEVFGAIELASFKPIEDYKVEFVEKLAESIATTVKASNISDRTKELLEQSQQQAEQLRSQEEEMRQNMEELQATQEEVTRKGKETQRTLKEVREQQQNMMAIFDGVPDAIIVTDKDGVVEDMNFSGAGLMGFGREEAEGKSIHQFLEGVDFAGNMQKSGVNSVFTGSADKHNVEYKVTEISKKEGAKYLFLIRKLS